MAKFTEQSQQLTGTARAEYLEIGRAFRVGCNLKIRTATRVSLVSAKRTIIPYILTDPLNDLIN